MSAKKSKKSKKVIKNEAPATNDVPSILIIILLALIVIGCIAAGVSAYNREKNDLGVTPAEPFKPTVFEKDENYTHPDINITHYAEIDIKDYGKITIALDATVAPITVENFEKLANSGFYDGLTFHRIMKGFMMQGGDPKANGTGGSGERIKGEFSANGVENNISHVRGAISMARSSNSYDSASSQFFIVHKDATQSLDGLYAAFGYVIDGIEIVDAVCEDARPIDSNGSIARSRQPIMNSVKVWKAEND